MPKFGFVECFWAPIPVDENGYNESVRYLEIPERGRLPIIPYQWKNEGCFREKLINDEGHECPAVFIKLILDPRFSGTGKHEKQTKIVWIEERQEWIAFQQIWYIFEDAYGYYSESISFAGPWSLDITHVMALLKAYDLDESDLVKMVPYFPLENLKIADINKYEEIKRTVQNSSFGNPLRTITEILAYLRSQTFLSDCYRYSLEENWQWAQRILTYYLYRNFDCCVESFQAQLEALAYELRGINSDPLAYFRQAEELMDLNLFEEQSNATASGESTQKMEHKHVWEDVPDTYKFVNPEDCPSAYIGGDDVYHVTQKCEICGATQTREGSQHEDSVVKETKMPELFLYPTNLQKIAIGRTVICLRCKNVWHDPAGQPDFNHCQPMLDTLHPYQNLSVDQKRIFIEHIEEGLSCPFYEPV